MSTHLEAARAALARAAEHMNRAENLLSIAQEAFATPLERLQSKRLRSDGNTASPAVSLSHGRRYRPFAIPHSDVYVCVCCESVSYRPVAGGREDEPLCVICGSAGCAPSLDSVQCRR